jgi:hypothetical protein
VVASATAAKKKHYIQNVHGGNSNLVSLEYSSEKNIEVDIDDENGVLPRCVRARTSALSHEDLSDFLNKTKNATFRFFYSKDK